MLTRAQPDSEHSDARRHGRVRIDSIRCSWGEVLDMSRSGMRVLTRRRGEVSAEYNQRVVIEAFDERVELPCRVAWIAKRGLFRNEIGIEFGEIPEDQTVILCRIARTAGTSAVMDTSFNRRVS